MQPTDFRNQHRDILTGVCNKVLIVRRRAGQVDIIATRHDEAVSAGVISAFDVRSPWTRRRTVAPGCDLNELFGRKLVCHWGETSTP
jgi:hypothetical protein